MKTILGIIPARGGSKGIPMKNLAKINAKTLLQYAIESGKGSKQISRLVVSTDEKLIKDESRMHGCEIIDRPPELGLDDTPTNEVTRHTLSFLRNNHNYSPDYIILIQPTAPLRKSNHIDEAIKLLIDSNADSVVSVAEVPSHFNPDWQLKIENNNELNTVFGENLAMLQSRRQELEKTYYRNGAIYACPTSTFEKYNNMYGKITLSYLMPAKKSISIDTEDDLFLAKQYINQ